MQSRFRAFSAVVGLFLVMSLSTLTLGCFDPYKIIEQETLRLPVTNLDADTRCLIVKVVVCNGNQLTDEKYRLTRAVSSPFGSEHFLLSRSLLHKDVILTISGYRDSSACELISNNQERENQHYYQRFTVTPRWGELPAVKLKAGGLQVDYGFCKEPKEPPPPPEENEPPAVVDLGSKNGSNLPSRYQPPTSAPDKPLTNLPSLLALNDEIGDPNQVIQNDTLRNPVQTMVSQGHWLAVIGKNTPYVHVIDLRSGVKKKSYEIRPDACNPVALDVQGDVLAIVCSGGLFQRVMWRSLDSRALEYSRNPEAPKELYSFTEVEAGLNPIDVKITGQWTLVLSCGERINEQCSEPELHAHNLHFPASQSSPQILIKLQEHSIEKPVGLAVAGDMVFVADGNNAADLHQFNFKKNNLQHEARWQIGMPATLLHANRRYVAVAGSTLKQEWLLKVFSPENSNPSSNDFLTFRLQQRPADLALFSHTVFVLYKGALLGEQQAFVQVIDLRTRVSRTLSLSASDTWDSMKVAGERLILASSQHSRLKVLELTKRKDLLQWRVGANTNQMFLVGSNIWVFDPLARRLRWMKDVSPPTPSAQGEKKPDTSHPYVAKSLSLDKADAFGWMTTYQASAGDSTASFVLYTGSNRTTLHINTLFPNDGSAVHESTPAQSFQGRSIMGGRVVGDTLYLLLWKTNDNSAPSPFLAQVKLNPQAKSASELLMDPKTKSMRPFDFKPFPNKNWEPVDILPNGSHSLIVADRLGNLYHLDADKLEQNRDALKVNGKPTQMARVKDQIAVAYLSSTGTGGSQVMMVRVADFTKGSTLPAYDNSSFQALHVFNNHLLLADKQNDVVMVCHPEKSVSCTTIRVGCAPSALAVVGGNTSSARLISANACDGTLSLSPLAGFLP